LKEREKNRVFTLKQKDCSSIAKKNLLGLVREIGNVFKRVRKNAISDYQLRHVRLSAWNNSAQIF